MGRVTYRQWQRDSGGQAVVGGAEEDRKGQGGSGRQAVTGGQWRTGSNKGLVEGIL